MSEVIPILDNVLIRPFPSENISLGGIVVADSFKVRNQKATVVAAGKGTKKRPMQFKPGDVAYNIQNSGEEIIIDGVQHFLVKDTYILAFEN